MSFLTSPVIQISENYFMLFSLNFVLIFLVSLPILKSMLIFLVFLLISLKTLLTQKIIVKRQVEQKFFWRNLALQEGRMCGVGPQATPRLIRASAQRPPALRGSLRGKNGINARKGTQT